jgi:hypothetical protein
MKSQNINLVRIVELIVCLIFVIANRLQLPTIILNSNIKNYYFLGIGGNGIS